MPIREPIPTESDENAPEKILPAAVLGNATLTRYLLTLFAVFALLYSLPFFLVRMPSYQQWSRGPSFRPMEFGFTAAGQNADVVIFGDSSAYHGLDPRRMFAALGTKVLILPTNLGELNVVDDLVLRRYIQADRPPRLIIFYFAPWNFDYHNDPAIGPTYDGMEMLMRHGTARDIQSFALAQPLLTSQFPLMFYRTNVNAGILAGGRLRSQAEQLILTNGHEDTPQVPSLSSACAVPSSLIDKIRFGSVREMSEKYRTPQTKVMYFAAPIPACTNAQSVIDRSARVLPAAAPKEMSASLYLEDPFYIHLYPAGVPEATQSLIDAVRPLLASH